MDNAEDEPDEAALSHALTRSGTRDMNVPRSPRRSPPTKVVSGLYLLTPDDADTGRLVARVADVIQHAALLQYRNKQANGPLRLQQALALQRLCAQAGVPLVVNDDPQLAGEAGANGVHLGEDDGDIASARKLLGDDAIIGVSCYDDSEAARQAVLDGASYVAFGAFFPSGTKPLQQRRATASLLRESARLGVPRVAIGGITPENAPQLVDAGADLVAVIAGVFDAPDPREAASAIAALFR